MLLPNLFSYITFQGLSQYVYAGNVSFVSFSHSISFISRQSSNNKSLFMTAIYSHFASFTHSFQAPFTQASLFNIACLYHNQPVSVSYQDISNNISYSHFVFSSISFSICFVYQIQFNTGIIIDNIFILYDLKLFC